MLAFSAEGVSTRRAGIRPARFKRPVRWSYNTYYREIQMRILKSLLMGPLLLLTGCATILGNSTQPVTINSEPPGSTVLITDESGNAIFKGMTPTTVTLEKSTGHYFGAKKYKVQFSQTGYSDKEMTLSESPDGWYFCNILLGGIIGMLLVDPWNGGMWSLGPNYVNPVLEKQDGKSNLAPAPASAAAPSAASTPAPAAATHAQ